MLEELEQPEPTQDAFDLNDIFNKRSDAIKNESKPTKLSLKKPPVEEEEEDEDTKETDVKDDAPTDKDEKTKEASIDYKGELEKLQKSVKDTQKSFHENRKQLAAYKKAVEKLKEDGSLLDAEAEILLDYTKFEADVDGAEKPLFHKWGEVWDKELQYLKKYAPDPKEIDQQIFAFQHFMQTATQSELDEMIKELSPYEDDEVEFTKQMLEIGRQYNLDIYSDIRESGSIRNLKSKYAEKEVEYQKKIDKLQLKYDKLKEKYEDYNTEPANMKLSSSSSARNISADVTFDPATIFESQYQRR